METPSVPVNFVPAKAGEILQLGTVVMRSVTPPSVAMELPELQALESRSEEGTYPKEASIDLTYFSRIIEDGSRTDMRIGVTEITVPARTAGPPPHWHEMHDEVFYINKGTIRFHGLDGQTVDAKAGDTMTVPTRSPHTFSNPFDEEASLINTYTPAHYINYFKLLATLGKAGTPMNPEVNRKAMAYFATIGVSDDEMKMKKEA